MGMPSMWYVVAVLGCEVGCVDIFPGGGRNKKLLVVLGVSLR